jgi:transcriptional regulator GlxA family with amidase domain
MTLTLGILLFDDVEELDFVGPWEVFTSTRMLRGGLDVVTFSENGGAVKCAKGLGVVAEHSFETVPPLDVLLVPGGQGTRREVDNPRAIAFLTAVAPRCRYVTSVCTGALLLHGAGLLEGKRATTHWSFCDALEQRGGVTVVRRVRYVRDGNVVTAAGVSAGIDMALWLVGQLFDPATARNVQRAIEYDPAPPYAADA